MAEEYFWGLTLSKDHPTKEWDPDMVCFRNEFGKRGDGDVDDAYRGEHTLAVEHTLVVSQAVLGPECPSGEVNVVQAEAMGYESDLTFPIAVLKADSQCQVVLDLLFPDPPVTFKLIQGNGPVHLLGSHSVGRLFDSSTNSSSTTSAPTSELDIFSSSSKLEEEDMEDLEDSPDRKSVD